MFENVCPSCRLPWDLCEHIHHEKSTVTLKTEKRTYGKSVVIVNGIKINQHAFRDGENENSILEKIARTLKKNLCCGGSVKKNEILLQTSAERVEAMLFDDFGIKSIEVQKSV
jgi:translation initiation factor 1 (eIF-1/SUI1)